MSCRHQLADSNMYSKQCSYKELYAYGSDDVSIFFILCLNIHDDINAEAVSVASLEVYIYVNTYTIAKQEHLVSTM